MACLRFHSKLVTGQSCPLRLWGGPNEEEMPQPQLRPPPASLPQALLWTQHGTLSGHSPVWAARPGAGRSEELPGFAEVAGIDLASVAGLGRQWGTQGVRGRGSSVVAAGRPSG